MNRISKRRTQNGKDASIATKILKGYRASDGCPPLNTHWGGYKLAKTAWLERFAAAVADDQNRTSAWKELNGCDTSRVIELLYLSTYRGSVRVDEDQGAYHLLKKKVDGLIRSYDGLCKEITDIIQNQKLSYPMIWHHHLFTEQLRLVQVAKGHLELARGEAAKSGSYKINARDWYLLLMATTVRKATGSRHLSALVTLIEAARAAHGEEREIFNEEMLKHRLQRYAKRMHIQLAPWDSKRKISQKHRESQAFSPKADSDILF